MFAWWRDQGDDDGDGGDMLLDDDLLEPPRREHIPFGHTLPNDGLLHTIDNCTADLGLVMPGYRVAVRKLKSLAKLIRSRGSKDKLLERCFGDGLGLLFQHAIKQYNAPVYLKRWGTVAFAIPEVPPKKER